jgi:hypothetical protein
LLEQRLWARRLVTWASTLSGRRIALFDTYIQRGPAGGMVLGGWCKYEPSGKLIAQGSNVLTSFAEAA